MAPARRGGLGPWLLAALLAASVIASFGTGLWQAWGRDGDNDMQERLAEYRAFRLGDYPNRHVDVPAPGRTAPYSVYPPYALPMFAVFFEPGSLPQGRFVVQLLSFAAVVLMGVYGHARLATFGRAWAAVGAVAGAAIAGNGTALALGQFSIVCAGMLVLLLMLLESRRGVAAGLGWAAAMLKPQIGVAFAVIFLVCGQVRGLLCGIAALAALGAAALWWTDASSSALVRHVLFGMPMGFAVESTGVAPAHLAQVLGMSHRVMQFAALALVVCLGLAAVGVSRRGQRGVTVHDLLPLTGMCAALGRVLTYHRHYDNVMLFPLLIAWLSLAVATPSVANVATAVAVGLSVWTPQRVQECVPLVQFVQPFIWIIAGLRLAGAARWEGIPREAAGGSMA